MSGIRLTPNPKDAKNGGSSSEKAAKDSPQKESEKENGYSELVHFTSMDYSAAAKNSPVHNW